MSLEDIAERNRRLNAGAPGIVRLFDRFQRTPPPAVPDAPFTLKRSKGTSPLLVIPVMLLLGAAIGLYACKHTGKKTEYEQRMMGESR